MCGGGGGIRGGSVGTVNHIFIISSISIFHNVQNLQFKGYFFLFSSWKQPLWYCIVLCLVVLCSVVLCCAMLCCAVLCCAWLVLCWVALRCVALLCVALRCFVLRCVALLCAVSCRVLEIKPCRFYHLFAIHASFFKEIQFSLRYKYKITPK